MLVSVQQRAAGELHCAIVSSDARTTLRTRATVPPAPGVHRLPPPLDHLSVETRDNADRSVAARLGDGEWIAATPFIPLNVLVLHTADRIEDSRYVAAAMRAIGGVAVDLKPASEQINLTTAAWIVWLSDEPVPGSITSEVAKRGADLLQDAERSRDARDLPAADSIVLDGATTVALFRRSPPSGTGASVWRDSFARPLLTVERAGAGRHWRFFSRFHPDWNDLPRSSALPAALRSLLIADEPDGVTDLRRATPAQAAPAEAARKDEMQSTLRGPAERIELKELFWTFAVLLFAIERALSYRSTTLPAAPVRARRREETPVLVGDAR
jgi:hypothetical protein